MKRLWEGIVKFFGREVDDFWGTSPKFKRWQLWTFRFVTLIGMVSGLLLARYSIEFKLAFELKVFLIAVGIGIFVCAFMLGGFGLKEKFKNMNIKKATEIRFSILRKYPILVKLEGILTQDFPEYVLDIDNIASGRSSEANVITRHVSIMKIDLSQDPPIVCLYEGYKRIIINLLSKLPGDTKYRIDEHLYRIRFG